MACAIGILIDLLILNYKQMKKIFVYILAIAVFTSCSKDEEAAKTSGEVILSSQIMGSGNNY
jgi:uncharacterized lipoprotein YajG